MRYFHHPERFSPVWSDPIRSDLIQFGPVLTVYVAHSAIHRLTETARLPSITFVSLSIAFSNTRALRERKLRNGRCIVALWWVSIYRVKCPQQRPLQCRPLVTDNTLWKYTHTSPKRSKQELSYRKQIARQLRTQYVEGIHRPRPKYYTVTLKSRLRVTQGHWKRNWTDHTRLTRPISRVIWR